MSDIPITQATPAPLLPAEISDTVIHLLHDDEKSLTNCSLVCKDWVPVARSYIFEKLLLHPWNVASFVDLITHPSATIAPYIRHLVIDQVKIRHVGLFQAMFLRFPRFDYLRRLELRNIRWCNYEAHSVDTLLSACNSATDVKFTMLEFDNATELWSVVARFPGLDHLSIIDPKFSRMLSHFTPGHQVDVGDIFPHLRPPNIHHLELSEIRFHLTHIVDWFSSRNTLVNSLSIRLGSHSEHPSLNQYLQVLGPSLLFLQLDVRYSPELYLPTLDLSYNTHLQKLQLCNFTLESRETLSTTIPSFFAKETSSYIPEIEFTYNDAEQYHVSLALERDAKSTPASSMWSPLDTVLSGMSGLRIVRFRLHQVSLNSMFPSYVKRGLALCDARGILYIEFMEDTRSKVDRRLGGSHSPLSGSRWDMYIRPDSWNGRLSGPLCIAQMQEPTA